MNKIFLRFTIQDQVLFAKRLSVLVRSGVPILQGLQMLRKQAKGSSQVIFHSLVEDVEKGRTLSTGMGRYNKVFSDLAINIVRIGEVSGTLHENLEYLAEELRKKQALRKKVLSALIYPIFIVVATFGITTLLLFYVFPKILPIFQSFQAELPWTTRSLIFLSNLIVHQGLWIGLGLIVLVVAGIYLWRIPSIRILLQRVILSMPFLGKVSQSYHMSNLCRTLGLLLKSEVMIVEAANIAAKSSTSLVYRRELMQAAENLTRGEKISTYLEARTKLFPIMLSQMVAVGENTGNLSESLFFLAELYENEVDEMTKNLSTLLEPILLVFMGMIVGFMAVSIITPIYELTQYLQP